MSYKYRQTLPKRLSITDLEYEIRRMESELEYHRKKARIFEETLKEQQQQLSRLQRRQRPERYIGEDLQ